uniref:multidrug resistance-associated protein 4-like n=1 Tax=Styela clava TaxID=7725 RepID=UPI001939A77A|nr:multidrug resistance-associated protein 4-like [Styela clava]
MNSFFVKGAKQSLSDEDMLQLSKEDTSETVSQKLEENWTLEVSKAKNGRKPSLSRAIVKTYAFFFSKIGLLILVEESLRTILPLMVARLISYFENMDSMPVSDAYMTATFISVISFFLAIFHHIYFYYVQRLGWHLRAAACALMYKKTLRLSQKALSETTTGQIVNLGATDVLRFDFLPLFIHYIWVGPLQSVICAYILWGVVGPAMFSGFAILFLIMICQSLNGKVFGSLRMKTAVITDERIRLMNEIITGMRIIKMYTWENPFAKAVAAIRKSEVRKVMWTAMLRSFNLSMFICAPKIIACVTFLVYIGNGGELTTSQVFTVIGIYNVIRVSMGLFFPLAIEKIAESRISVGRIEKFLLLDETKNINQVGESGNSKCGNNSIDKKMAADKSFVEIINFDGSWDDNGKVDKNSILTLKNINIRVSSGQLLAVIGPVGSGKSSFLSAILGELPASSGEIKIQGDIAYANQVPWVFAGSVQENILFGEEYDADWYDTVVHACGLERDFELLPNGDSTIVGERGVTLSGGQKARVNLARAAYRKNANIYLLDDPLSAVDAAVGNHLFQHCISGIMKDKVCILVTHQLQLLQDADIIIILKEGKIVGQGTYNELQADGTDFAALLEEKDEVQPGLVETQLSEIEDENSVLIKQRLDPEMTASTISLKSALSQEMMGLLGEDPIDSDTTNLEDDKNGEASEEMRVQGSVGRSVYLEYFRVGSSKLFCFFFIIVILLSHISFILCDWWISMWATKYEEHQQPGSDLQSNVSSTLNWSTTIMEDVTLPSTSESSDVFDTNFYMIIYACLTAITYICIWVRAIMHFYLCVSSGIHMHKKMFYAILRSPIRFFDTNPSGRVLNRFSKDIGQIDDLLPLTFFDFLYIFGLIASILILAIIVNFMVAVITLPLVVVFFWLRQYYLKTSRDIKRLEGSTRSPVFSLLSSTLQGLTTVRAFRVQDTFEKKFHERQNLHSSAWYLFLCGGRWLGVRLDLLSAIFITTVTFMCLITISFIDVDPGQVGLSLTYCITLLGMFQWGVRQSTEVENLMTSVERVQQYYSIPSEAADEKPDKKPPASWPNLGIITFDRVSFAYYSGGPDVLKKVRFNVKSQEKVGIVGRTGAGKSSLISALFRLSELTSGEIYIDGIAITPLGLNDLRRALSIIPQDPILFTGTMRRNLDPFTQYSDEDLWDSLEQVQLREVVESLPLKLDSELAESGSNFSVGQRQLVCLARAILKKSKILVIDEATANVDLRTDRLIQVTIREKFKYCTVLTIAHRIHTIIDSDRVMVLDAGKVIEFDHPHTLLRNYETMFSKMVETTANGAAVLKKMAEEAYKSQNQPKLSLPTTIKDSDRSYLSRFTPSPETYDAIEFETGL